ncbi:glycosyltransferase [Clostridium perfringens]|uniref:glycosyltransferase n=1 Tax=Clostridium perfringens TaxID=1502 RepID=UPI0013E2B843|nr:glycosyltransferase [Clostridium perfringens]MDG6890097.1 putative glycosyltransferase EpsE [Clostridium perfringens]MDK0655136.1 glycosyltransferase [Clostridium perfringens]MDK0689229.1 glycosyltransferase [Clostridium perfringens]MDM0506541.1 glycosyltransferase [Clostridium perfringens]MDM0709770.1 glycosyltransferase [Clostridium perfringens]
MKELTVIMPVYNEKEDWVIKSINSILKQSYSNFDFIILLDNPKNEKLKNIINNFAKSDPRIIFEVNSKNIGLVKTLNKGLKLSKTKYIARMDADDISCRERFREQINFLKRNKDVKLVGTNWVCIDENDDIMFQHNSLPTDFKFIKKNLKYNNMFLHPSWMFDSEILNVIKGYREVQFAEDYDFISRMISNNFKVSNINEFLVKYRVRKNSISISRAYEQYLSSERVIKYMKERRYGNDSYELEQEFYKNISDKERKKYFLATEAFIKSRERLNEKKYFLFFNEFLKSFFISRYRFKKNINIIIYNLKIKLHNMKNK